MTTSNRPIIKGLPQQPENILLRQSGPIGVEHDDVLGVRRSCTQISWIEIIFLGVAILATIATDGLSIYRMTEVPNDNPDFVYGILIIISSGFLLLFLITGIFQQRIMDIVAFFICAVLLTIYVVVHYVLRKDDSDDDKGSEKTIRLVRLICTAAFNLLFLPLSILVIRDYQRDEFSKRLIGARVDDRWPLRIYNIFDCVVRINTMLSVSVYFLNLYNFNEFLKYDKVFLGIGIPYTLLWLGLGVGMIRLENRILMAIFYLISLFQLVFLILCLISAIEYPSTSTTSTTKALDVFATTIPSFTNSDLMNLIRYPTRFSFYAMLESARQIPVTVVLYVCVGLNAFTHILTIVLSVVCVRNFGKGLKDTVFISKPDRFFQNLFSKCCGNCGQQRF